ncbi:MAG TPA: Ada metal-binding domain-containing protein [Gemmatimonadales bacterium]|jgi:AraC family transcriptional regulator of adaptative response / DNA-3-methyladenine glycosylase II
MLSAAARSRPTRRDAFQTAVDARDQRFDGVFFVGITTTRIYCRPACKSRLAYDNHRRFFNSAAAAERAGFRPCLRCRPELSPGRTDVGGQLDAVSRLARLAAQRIAAGALNGHTVAELATELGVSERHLRRALEREISVSPLELAQTHRLLLAKRLIMDTDLPMTRVAYASGFQSLRRFNAVFREQYRMPPSALRRGRARVPDGQPLRITLAYRAPLAWNVLLRSLGAEGETWRKSVEIESHHGTVIVENEPAGRHLVAEISDSLLPVLMPLIAGLRRVFDLDAEPAVIDAHLSKGGLSRLIARWPGVRVPGTLEGPVSPDAFDASDRRLQRAAGVIGTKALRAMSERWRPWRAYAAELLKLESID